MSQFFGDLMIPLSTNECERFQSVLLRLKYPLHIINSIINAFINSRIVDQQSSQASPWPVIAENDVIQMVIPFKDQDCADIVKILVSKHKPRSNPCLLVGKLAWTSKNMTPNHR